MSRPVIAVLVVSLMGCWGRPAAAHDRTTSYSTWDLRGRSAHVTVRLSLLDVTRLPWSATAGDQLNRQLGAYLTARLQLLADGEPCPVADGPRTLDAAVGRVAVEWQVKCPPQGALRIRSAVLLDVAPAHLHFARVARDGGAPLERVLSEREPTWLLADPSRNPPMSAATPSQESRGTSLLGYLQLGIDHILSGYDHLAFLLALLLIGGSIGEVAKVVTGFTVAHSMTLGLTVLGYVRPDSAPIEALIGLSIALVAAENVWLTGPRRPALPLLIAATLGVLAFAAGRGHGRVPALTLIGLAIFIVCYFGLLARVRRAAALRWAIAFIFGLVHGFGFASVLVEAGLPTERLVAALFGFNAGVEVGQLAVVACVWPLLRYVTTRGESWRFAVLNYGSAAVLTLGVFWFVSRAFG
ncbi:MAG TPA: HupE/UreJ family protein [Candidatus Kryptonia bacterium]|nr:HupE/UreJ family protein [Candidatus Kryptonia bacterium]